ncbi:MAG: 50S ribosome-binding GTPase, partial [Clostridia bacterium]|nr:50S ribosome-binding GTPase [Clostridia bacterium]
MATLNETPRADRLHIGFFGKRNAGKSTLVNLITGQEISIVSDVAGTTTDVVYKSIEISGLGPCEIMDTAGFDDVGGLGEIRVEKTKKAAEKANIAVIAIADDEMSEEIKWY